MAREIHAKNWTVIQVCDDLYVKERSNNTTVAEIKHRNKEHASLIATAPELLDALEGIVEGFGSSFQENERFKKARAVISKAKGQ